MAKNRTYAPPIILLAAITACSTATQHEPKSSPQPTHHPMVPAPAGEMASMARRPTAEEPLEPMPSIEEVAEALELELIPARIDLGRHLFHDTRLSKDHTVSCASCHDLRFAGIDRTPKAVGIHGQVGDLNTPTVFNSALGIAQFWDGRASDLASQAEGPPQAAGEMGSNFAEITSRLQQDQGMLTAFRQAFPGAVQSAEDITTERILQAIATFEVTLLTPDARFDRWLTDENADLTEQELRGYATFKEVGCAQCHYGPGVGGKTFQRLGQKKDFFSDRQLTHADLGRYNVTKDERDRHTFKVPTLRNITLTAPYLHDGSVATLEEAVRVMGTYQLGIELSPQQVADIVAFLGTLTGTYQGRPLQAAPR
jgi:cytochrome c peroxidase